MSKHRVRSSNRVFRSHVPMAPLSIAAAVAAAIGAPSIVWAQSADAALEGIAAPNSEVTLVNKENGSTRRTTTRADGSYSIVGLQPGTYTVSSGGNSKDVVLSVATTGRLDLVAENAP